MARPGPDARHWRLRVLLVVAPVAVLLLATTTLVPDPRVDDTVVAPGASRTTCLRTGDIADVGRLDQFVSTVRGDAAFQGGDVGASVALQDGRQLFVFGDTLRAEDFDGQQLVRNSMLVFTPECAQVVLPADGGALIPDRSDGVGYWPMSVARVERPGYDLVGVSTQRVRGNGDEDAGVFAFDVLGASIALFVVPSGGTPQLIEVRDLGPDRVDTTRPIWGAAVAVADGWVYTYGTARPQDAVTGGFSLRVARVRPDDLLDQRRWQWWDGSSWTGDAATATELIPAQGGVSQTLSVFRSGDTWYAVSKRDEVLGSDLTIWTAPAPEGPFTASPTVAEIPSDAATGTLRYLPLAHPDLLPEPGTVVVSYSQNNTDVGVVRDDPRLYRPRFLRVDLPS